jgi:hypothetical protein|nr:MAG TPA: hypothetical protein [Caudoviricetes sp.]
MSKNKHPEKHLETKVKHIVFDAIFLYDKSKSGDVYLFNVADMSDIVKKITDGIVEVLS